jgi:hypothetical protein
VPFYTGRENGGPRTKPLAAQSFHEEPAPVSITERITERERLRSAVNQIAPDLSHEVEELSAELVKLTTRLNYLRAGIEPGTPAGDLVGIAGNAAEEIRLQIRPLREALKGGDAA